MTSPAIPNRPVFRAQEVCEIAQVQAYVLRSWEAEFPDLGVAKSAGAPRVYRKADVQRVLRLKHLLFVDGLTLAGARRKLMKEGAAPVEEGIADADVAAMLDEQTRRSLQNVKRGLEWIHSVLSGDGANAQDAVLAAEPPPSPAKRQKMRTPAARTKQTKARKLPRSKAVKARAGTAKKRATSRKRKRS